MVHVKDKQKEQPQKSEKVVLFGNAAVAATCYMKLMHDSDYEGSLNRCPGNRGKTSKQSLFVIVLQRQKI